MLLPTLKVVLQHSLPFYDADKISSYALDGVATSANYGLITGKNNNLFDHKGKATRAEVAVVLSKLLKKYGSQRIKY